MKKYLLLSWIVVVAACSSSSKVSNIETATNVDLAKFKTFDF